MANNEYREPQQAASELKTPAEWCDLFSVEILDPDGWRGSKGRPWTDPITAAEFNERLVVCTMRHVTAAEKFRQQQQADREHGLKARHETRQERAVRRAVADRGWPLLTEAMVLAREIGSKGGEQ